MFQLQQDMQKNDINNKNYRNYDQKIQILLKNARQTILHIILSVFNFSILKYFQFFQD